MKAILFLLFLVDATLLFGQSFVVNTTRFVGCGGCNVTVLRSIATNDGGVLFVGNTDCYSGGGDIPPSMHDTTGSLDGNVVIGKLDTNMNVSWVRVYGGNQYDGAVSAVQTADGGYAVLAYTYSVNGDVSGNHAWKTADLWLIRTDANGYLLWQKCYGSAYDEHAISIALAPDNGFILMGDSYGMGGDVPAHYTGSPFDPDWFVVKTDSDGNIQWTKTIGGSAEEYYRGAVLAADGGYYVIGSSISADHDCTDNSWHPTTGTGQDYYVFRLDAVGNIAWGKSYGGSAFDIVYDAIWDSRDNSIVINGLSYSDDYLVTDNKGGADMLVLKIDKDGNIKWHASVGADKNEYGTGVCISPTGYVAYGYTWPDSKSWYDNWVASIESDGSVSANKIFGGDGTEHSCSIFPFKQGYAATGFSNSFSFTEGSNVGHPALLSANFYLSYILYDPTSVENLTSSLNSINAFPNPCNGRLFVETPEGENGTLTITNAVSKLMYLDVRRGNAKNLPITTEKWPQGLYIVTWTNEDGNRLSRKLLVI
jgi:hypothetical protein